MAELSEIRGTAGNDTLNGTAGNDTIYGNGGNDTISGNGGDDTITGGTGVDLFKFAAGDGKDTIRDLAAGETVQISGYGAAQSITQVGGSVVVVFSGTDQITFNNSTVATVQAALQFSGAVPPSGPTEGDDTLTGGSGDDNLYGLGGNDTIAGGSGNDTIDGGDGYDRLFSGDASAPWSFPYYGSPYTPPLLDTGSQVDTLNGGAGDDIIFAGYGDTVDGGDGNDYLYISFQGATSGITVDFRDATVTVGSGTISSIENVSWVEGSEHNDTITMSSDSPYTNLGPVFGMGGNDTLVAGYYTALLDGGDGDDIVDGRASQYLQQVDGGAGDDILYTNTNTFAVANGGDGNDTIYAHGEIHGGAGNDTIHVVYSYYPGPVTGDAGDDAIYGDFQADNLAGNDGNDTLDGKAGSDTLDGGAGADLLTGGAGDDSLTGGADADRFVFQQGDGRDIITDFGTGDVVELNGFSSAQSITQVGSDVVVVLSADDQITFTNADIATVQAGLEFASPTDDTISGGPDADYLRGFGGNDTISGQGGSDTLAGGSGGDALSGGDGNDTLFSGDVSPPWSFPYYGNPYTPPLLDTGSEVDTLIGGAGDDVIFAGHGDNVDGGGQDYYGDKLFISFQGATSGVTFDGTLDTQTIGGGTITGIENISWVEGSDYDDYINVQTNAVNGYSDRTTVFGMGGNDTLLAGYYTGVLDGGDGNDIVDGRGSQYLQQVNGGAGDDTLYTNTNTFAVANGGDGNDTIYAHGEIHGGAGDDTIHVVDSYYRGPVTGDDGNDTIYGSANGDQLDSGAGNDVIQGGGGDDVLRSGAGDDVLTGGSGNDQFFVGDGNDVITDFSAGDTLYIQTGFSADSIIQTGSNVVITLANNNQLTIQNTDVATVKASLQSSVQVNDIGISADSSTIYAAGADGNLYVYSAATGEFLQAWHVGTELGGMDISPDGTFAMVVELEPVRANYNPDGWPQNQFTVTVHKVDLSTGQVTSYPLDVTGENYSFYDVAVLADGKAILSESIVPGWSGGGRTLILDTSTGTYTVQSFGGQDTVLSVSADGKYVLLAPENQSDGPLLIYGFGQGVIASHTLYDHGGSGFNRGVQAISNDGRFIAQSIYGDGLNIYNSQLQLIVDLAQSHPDWRYGTVSGVAFDPSGKILFVLDNQTDIIVALSTSDWSTVAELPVGADVSDWSGDFGNRLLVAPDMNYFTVVTGSGFVKVDAVQAISGTVGNDSLNGTVLNDDISGLDGSDVLAGNAGNDTLEGGAGNDTLRGGTGNDTLHGGDGTDTFEFAAGDGMDTIVDLQAGEKVNITGYTSAKSITQVGSNVVVVLSSTDQITFLITDVATVRAALPFGVPTGPTEGDDVLNGTTGADNINGLGGNDTIYGDAGNDTLAGGAGNDILDGGIGGDKMSGGTGDDVYIVDSSGDSVTELSGQGLDVAHAAINYTLGANVENGVLDGSAVSLTGNTLNNSLKGNAAANTLNGGDGNDILDGMGGADTLNGGEGNDTYIVDNAGDRISDTRGTDEVVVLTSYTLASRTAIEKMTAIDNGVAISLTGNEFAQTITGNNADNFLYGMSGNDTLVGGGGNDTLRGGLGADILTGGGGADHFVFESANGNDRITDFQSGTDKIDLRMLGITSANVKSALSNGNTVISVDANKDGVSDFTITLTGVTQVDSSDYIFG